jgi:ubiquinone/menaquinone biosynthesis C-methylase UbiE
MTQSDNVFTGAVPENYDRYLVPMIFADYARNLARLAAHGTPKNVLETAAGSGVVTRALAPLLDPQARYVVSDLNAPMLSHARSVQPEDPRIDWRVADALALPFDEGEFDVVLCQFGTMFFPDRIAGYMEARRVLRPNGVFLFNVWDRIEDNEFADVVTHAVGELFPNDPPLFLKRTPHGYHDVTEIERELRAAGYSEVRIETRSAQSPAASARIPAQAYCQGTPLRDEIIARDPDGLERATQVAEQAIAARWGTGPISAKIQGHIITARP